MSLYEYFKNEENMNQVKELLKYVFIKTEEKKDTYISDNLFKGTKIYATGKFANYKKEEIKKVLEDLGAEFANGYAKSLNYLIVGSIEGSSKEEKAKKDGIPVLTEQQFNEMIGRIN
jgi:DNA ligase (NAD+)